MKRIGWLGCGGSVSSCLAPAAALVVALGHAGAMLPQAPGRAFEVEREGYRASFDEAAVTFTASPVAEGGEASVHLRLRSVGRRSGEMDSPPVLLRRTEGDRVLYERAGVVELYELRDEGLKQSFEFARLPRGSGDLVVRLEVDTQLPLQHADERGIRFGADAAGVLVGAVVGLDAVGTRAQGSMRWSHGILELSLPEAFVQHAALPLILDPLISPVANVATLSRYPPSFRLPPNVGVGYLPGADAWFAAWTSEDNSEGGRGTLGRLLAADGTPLGPVKTFLNFSAGPFYADHAQVAAVAGARRFAVAMIGGFFVSETGWIASVDELGNFPPAKSITSVDVQSIDVGGEATAVEDDVLVAYSDYGSIYVTEVDILTLDTLQTLALTPVSSGDRDVAITPSGGVTGRYLVTWRRSSGAGDVWGAVLDRNLGVLAAPFPIAATAAAEGDPDVDGDGTRWVVAFERATPSGDNDIVCRGVSYDAQAGRVRLTNERVVEGDLAEEERDPAVAWMGESYLIAFTEQYSGSDYDVYVKSLESFDCLDCEGELLVYNPSTADEGVAVASQRSAGGSGAEAMLSWVVTTDQNSPLGAPLKVATIEQRRFRADDGVVRDLRGGCGRGGVATATCGYSQAPAFGLRVEGAAPRTQSRLVLGVAALGASCGPCTFVPDPIATLVTRTDGKGEATISFPMPDQLSMVGQRVLAQWLVDDPSGCTTGDSTLSWGLALSNAIEITIQ